MLVDGWLHHFKMFSVHYLHQSTPKIQRVHASIHLSSISAYPLQDSGGQMVYLDLYYFQEHQHLKKKKFASFQLNHSNIGLALCQSKLLTSE